MFLRVVALPSQSPIGHLMDPAALGKENLYSLESFVSGGIVH